MIFPCLNPTQLALDWPSRSTAVVLSRHKYNVNVFALKECLIGMLSFVAVVYSGSNAMLFVTKSICAFHFFQLVVLCVYSVHKQTTTKHQTIAMEPETALDKSQAHRDHR